MEFVWDAAKDAVNRQKHGIRFADAVAVFADPDHLEEDSTRPEYGEERRRAIGAVQGRTVTVVYTDRGQTRRIILARRARKDERDRYDQGTSAS